MSLRRDTVISAVFFWGGGVGWGGGSHECPRFQSTAQKVFVRGQLYVVVCGTWMTATVIQVFIQPQTEVSTEEKKKRKTIMYIYIYEVVMRIGCKKYISSGCWQGQRNCLSRGDYGDARREGGREGGRSL